METKLDKLADEVRTAHQQFAEMKQQEAEVARVAWRERGYQLVIVVLLLVILGLLAWVIL